MMMAVLKVWVYLYLTFEDKKPSITGIDICIEKQSVTINVVSLSQFSDLT
jgi:hypothetical protein